MPVELGVRITNRSSTPYRFNLPGFLPELINGSNQSAPLNYAANSRWKVQAADIPILQSNETSVSFLWNAHLRWQTEQSLCLGGYANYGAVWHFCDLQPGRYQIQLKYQGLPQSVELLMQGESQKRFVEHFWAGAVHTPLVEFRLVNSELSIN